MATLDGAGILSEIMKSTPQTTAGFTMGQNALQRGQITADYGLGMSRVDEDYNLSLPQLAGAQAARGAFHSGGTKLLGDELFRNATRAKADMTTKGQYSLAALGLSDWATQIPGFSQ